MKLNIETAKKMGRDQVPLRLRAIGRTLVICKQLTGDGLAISLETGRHSLTAVRTLVDQPARPNVADRVLSVRGMFMALAYGEQELVEAWLDGYYGAES